MTNAELIIGLFTFGCWALTVVKIYRKHVAWYWNLAPMGMGACILAWTAKLFG